MTVLAVRPSQPANSIAAIRRTLAGKFAAYGFDTPALDARILVGHALGLDHAGLAASPDRLLDTAEIEKIDALAARRLRHEPIARITGVKEFWGLPLRVSPATLVPRPDTETVVETALAALAKDAVPTRTIRIADLGTGSGALLLALLAELPNAFGIGTDCDTAALKVARENAERLGLSKRAAFLACDFGSALAGSFDLVVSNPPYVRSDDIAALASEVRDYDPRAALDGGSDGLAGYRKIADDARRLVVRHGHLVVEIGAGQEAAVTSLFRAAGLDAAAARSDLAGTPRALHMQHL